MKRNREIQPRLTYALWRKLSLQHKKRGAEGTELTCTVSNATFEPCGVPCSPVSGQIPPTRQREPQGTTTIPPHRDRTGVALRYPFSAIYTWQWCNPKYSRAILLCLANQPGPCPVITPATGI